VDTNNCKCFSASFARGQKFFSPYSFKRLEKWRAIRDHFKTSVENLVQEIFEQIYGVLALSVNPDIVS